jgi:hypothetical protein
MHRNCFDSQTDVESDKQITNELFNGAKYHFKPEYFSKDIRNTIPILIHVSLPK